MRNTKTSKPRSPCAISTALELVGDPWSLLVVRDLKFKRFRTFNEFLHAGEGIASNILTERLGRLERHGIIAKSADAHDARRYFYRLTEKGLDLAPVLMELVIWAAKHEQTGAPASVVRDFQLRRPQILDRLRKDWAGLKPRTIGATTPVKSVEWANCDQFPFRHLHSTDKCR